MQIQYDLPLPEVVNEGEEWLCLSKNSFMWRDDDFICPFANPTYSSKHTPKGEDAIGQRVSTLGLRVQSYFLKVSLFRCAGQSYHCSRQQKEKEWGIAWAALCCIKR